MALLKGLLAPTPFILTTAFLLVTPAGVLAGAWIWPSAWIFLAVFAIAQCAASAILAVVRPAAFAVRQQGLIAPRERRQPLIDAVGSVAYAAFIAAWLAFIPLDVFRLHLLAAPDAAVSAAGGLAAITGVIIATSPSPITASPRRPSTTRARKVSG